MIARPDVAASVEDEGGAVESIGQAASQANAALRHDHVQVVRRAPQQVVADVPAHQPSGTALAGE